MTYTNGLKNQIESDLTTQGDKKMKIKKMNEYNPQYINGELHWKKIGEKTGKLKRKKKIYPCIKLDNILLLDEYEIDEKVLKKSREQYESTQELIPVYLSFDLKLIYGYEQYILAKELGLEQIPFQRSTNRKEFDKSVSNEKFDNKCYSVKDINGAKIYITLNQYKKVNSLVNLCKDMDFTLQILPDFTFTVIDNNGEIIIEKAKLSIAAKLIKEVKKWQTMK